MDPEAAAGGPAQRGATPGPSSAPAAPAPQQQPLEPYTARQFDRSSSFSGLARCGSIEMAAGGGGSSSGAGSLSFGDDGADDDAGGACSSSSSDDEGPAAWAQQRRRGQQQQEAGDQQRQQRRQDAPGRGSSGNGGGGEGGAAAERAFFEVEPPSTENAFIIRGLRESLSKKEEECEHLRQIIKELSLSRAKVQKAKVDMEEAYTQLQKEYLRVVKVSEIARTVSQQSLSRSNAMRKELQAAQDSASRERRRGAAAADRARRLKAQNSELRRRVEVSEALAASALCGVGESVCVRQLLEGARAGLY